MQPINVVGASDEEKTPFFNKEEQTLEMLRLQARQARITQFAVVVALTLATAVFLGLGLVVWRVNDSMQAMERQIAPHADALVNSSVQMMAEIGGASMDFHKITGMTKDLASSNLGPTGPAGRAINSTALIADRVASFLKHPTLKLSLGDE